MEREFSYQVFILFLAMGAWKYGVARNIVKSGSWFYTCACIVL